MPKKLSVKTKQKYMIIGAAIFLALLGYFLYRSMLTTPSVNKIDNWYNDGKSTQQSKVTKEPIQPKNTPKKTGK